MMLVECFVFYSNESVLRNFRYSLYRDYHSVLSVIELVDLLSF